METLNTLFEISVYSGVILIAIMLLKACFNNKMSPLLHYAVWSVFVLRLMLPVTIASPVRLFIITAEPQNQTALEEAQPQVYEPAGGLDIIETNIADPQSQAGVTEGYLPGETEAAPVTAHMPLSMSLPQVITLIWLAGAGVFLSYLAVLYASLRGKLRRNAARPSRRLIELFEQVKAEMGIKSNIKLVCLYEYGTPSLMFPKTIMMPADALIAMNDEQTMFALRHELTHYRRGDHIVSILLSLLNAVYWFNPFVWAAFRQMRKDMETACDGAVVKTLCTAAKSRYASLIVSLSAQPAHRQLVLGMSRSGLRKTAERRVKSVFMKGRSRMSVKLITALLAAALLFTCFTTACQPVTAEADILQRNAPNQSAESRPPQAERFTAPAEWKDELVQSETGNTVKINAQVVCPAFDSVDTVSISSKNFTQDEVDALIKYFVGDAALYDGAYQDTKANLKDRVAEAQEIVAMTQDERDADIGGMTDEEAQQQLEDLQARYDKAPDQEVKVPVTSRLTRDNEGFEVLEVYTDNGGSDDAVIEVFNLAQENNNASFLIRLRDASAGGTLLPYSGTLEEAAQKVLSGLNISGTRLLRRMQATASNDPDNTKKVTRLFYERTIGGLPIRGIRPETISVDVSENGPTCFYWSRHSEIGEPVEKNVALLPFGEITRKFEGYIFLEPLWGDPAKGSYQPNIFNITSVELCMAAVPNKDLPGEYILIPAWEFYGYQDLSESVKAFRLDRPSADTAHSLMTLSAVDGTLLNR